MRVIQSNKELTAALGAMHPVFVPTMGALHEGHLELIRRAAGLALPKAPVVVSIFVNPTQFGPNEDFARYPRMLDADTRAAASAGAQIIFAPEIGMIYPPEEKGLAKPAIQLPPVATQPGLEDAHRPGHFAGVCQVVARLFDLVQPSIAVFGEKDYQQLLVIKAMVAQEGDRWKNLQIVAHPTVREPDGLALSSRNMFLKAHERDRALGLWRGLQAAKGAKTPSAAEAIMQQTLQGHGLQIDYAAVRDAQTLMRIDAFEFDRPARGLIAARLGSVRLIDNASLA